jgi:hypothetical protein
MARGRRPRVPGAAVARRVELRLTLAEWQAVRHLAERSGTTIADTIRLALVGAAADAGDLPPVVLGDRLIRILAGKNSAAARPSDSEVKGV